MKDTYFGRQHKIDISKELEIINFRVLEENQLDDEAKERRRHWFLDDSKPDDERKNKVKDQFTSFQKAMRVLIIWGQCFGLNPVIGILQKDVTKMRFSIYSWKFLFAITMAIFQTIGTVLCFYKLFKAPSSMAALAYVTFFMASGLITILFIRIASKWPTFIKQLIKSRLDDYIDPNINKKCKIVCCVFIAMAVIEHIMSNLTRVSQVLECSANATTDLGEIFVKVTSPWLYELNVPYVLTVGIIIQYINIVTTATWNYADMFIICISLYLTSILEQINKRITTVANKNFLPSTIWAGLREDYTRASHLVKLFDDMFSGIVLVAFSNDLFFICLQLYNALSIGIFAGHDFNKFCPDNNSLFRLYSYFAYLTYSTTFICIRFLSVSISAAGVNTASLAPAPVLFTVPTTAYSKEVERFQSQVKGDMIALSGLHFFYITRDLVLTVAGTIVTYELVLFQFSDDDE